MKNFLSVLVIVCFLLTTQIVSPSVPVKDKNITCKFLKVSSNMMDLLDREVMPVRGEKRRLDKIVELIFDRSVVGFDYSSTKTYTASETFELRSGNCLSYTAMFISMARYAGLNARFQEVSDFSDWSRQGGIVVFSSHMNSVVIIGTKFFEVDFQYRSEKKFWNRKVVDDRRAEAHYFNNIGSEALLKGDLSTAGTLLSRSIEHDGSFSYAWTNLGVLAKQKGEMKKAEAFFLKAIVLDRNNHTAKYNLAVLYELKGNIKKAENLRSQIKKILRRNPYYHFRLGIDQYDNNNFNDSIIHFKRAIKRDSKKSEFYIKLSAAYYKLGNFKMSEKYLKKGEKYAETDLEKDKYKRKLEYIFIKLKEKK